MIRNYPKTVSSHLGSQTFRSHHSIIYYTTCSLLLLNISTSDAYPSLLKSEKYSTIVNGIQEQYPHLFKKPSIRNTNHAIPDSLNGYNFNKNTDNRHHDKWYNIQGLQSNESPLLNVKVSKLDVNDLLNHLSLLLPGFILKITLFGYIILQLF